MTSLLDTNLFNAERETQNLARKTGPKESGQFGQEAVQCYDRRKLRYSAQGAPFSSGPSKINSLDPIGLTGRLFTADSANFTDEEKQEIAPSHFRSFAANAPSGIRSDFEFNDLW